MSLRQLVAVSSILIVSPAFAGISVNPDPSYNGSYAVSWTAYTYGSYYRLWESTNGGQTWGSWPYKINKPATSKSFTNKPPGTYTYKVKACRIYSPHPGEEFEQCSDPGYGQEDVLVCGPECPTIDPLETQYDYGYETRAGDINGDGRQDILLDRVTVADAGNGTLDAVLLRRKADGSFATIIPTQNQLNIASSWPVVAIELYVSDVNLDGFVDVLLKDVTSVATGALDQLIFAPGKLYATLPKATTPVNSTLQQFLTEFQEWAVGPTYFDDNAIYVPESGYWDTEVDCSWFMWGDQWEYECSYYPVWVEVPDHWDYSHFNQDAYELALIFGNSAVNLNIPPGSTQGSLLEDIFERVFGTDIFGGVLSGGGTAPWEIDVPIGDLGGDRGFTFGIMLFSFSETVTARSDWRPLTIGERLLIAQNSITLGGNAELVKVYNKSFLGLPAFAAPDGNIYVSPSGGNWRWREDYSIDPSVPMRSYFIHESVHLYQYYNEGCRIVFSSCRFQKFISDLSYDYVIVPGKDYYEYKKTEHRAEMVSDRWLKAGGYSAGYSFNNDVTYQQLAEVVPFPFTP